MAEALYHLSDSLAWTPTSAPQGQLVLPQDCVEATGAFLVHHLTSLFLKADHRVCFVASANSPEHYAVVGRKLGVNFAACRAKKQLQVLDWTRLEADKEAEWTTLFEDLRSFAKDEQETRVSIVLDDVSALKWRFGDTAVLDFVRCCKTLTHEKNGAANVVLLSHADTDLPTSRPLSPALADMATVVLATKPLTTGYSKDIHGTLLVHRQNQSLSGNSLHEEPIAIPYKILESTIKCFHSGGEALRFIDQGTSMLATQDLLVKPRGGYKQLAHIGRGSYGDVFLCKHSETGDRVCVKEMDLTFLSPEERVRCLTEVALLQQLPAHLNIVGFREAFWAQSLENIQQLLVLVLEHADGGDLEQSLRSCNGSLIKEKESRRIFIQLAQGVNHLHRHRVVHRDLKSGNVFLFRSGRVVLGDFGTSKLLPSTVGTDQVLEARGLTSTVVGSPLYMSPELLEGEAHGFATDIWSLGCVLYEMLSGGKPAFGAPSYPAVVFRITQGEYDPFDLEPVSPEARDLIASMLQKAPQNRPSIVEVLQSPWLQCPLCPAPIDVNNVLNVSPPPAPVARARKSPIRQTDHPNRSRRHAKSLRDQVASPLIRLDEQPPPPAILPSRKHLSISPSIPFKHHHLLQHKIRVQTTSELEIQGHQITGTLSVQPTPNSIPKL